MPKPCRLPRMPRPAWKIMPLLAWVGVCLPAVETAAQRVTNVEALRSAALRYSRQAAADKLAAEAWARDRALPVRWTRADGTVLELMSLRDGQPVYRLTCNAMAADTVSTDELWPGGSSGLNLDGTDVLLGIWDAGRVRGTHLEFAGTHLDGTHGRAVQRDWASGLDRHATHVAGTMIAAGVLPAARGMSFNGSLDCYEWTSDYAEMLAAAADGLLVSNHSYTTAHGWVDDYFQDGRWAWLGNQCISGVEDYQFGFYGAKARQADQLAYDAPYYLACWAAGNDRSKGPHYWADPDLVPIVEHWAKPCGSPDYIITDFLFDLNGGLDGYDCLSDEALAKNVLTVGAVQDLAGGYGGPASVLTASFSSMGPTDDGRIKPDISANGIGLRSSVSDSDDAYGSFSGTSMATPNVSGTLGLLIQHYRATHGGADPRAATLKALVLHTADECGDYPGPDYMFGWGLLNANKAAGRITSDLIDDQNIIREETLPDGGTFQLTVQADGNHPLRATICWTDPPPYQLNMPQPSLNPSQRMLVNDLDLTIRATPAGTTFFPWVLSLYSPSSPAYRAVNDRDNVEQVYIDNPPPGEYFVEVTHNGTLRGGSQDFSLIVTAGPDCNRNGIDDHLDLSEGISDDCDANAVPDECDPDSDWDGTIDGCDGCPYDPFKVDPGVCGCFMPEDPTDTDGDQTPDCADACPDDAGKTDPLLCGCGLPETDSDGDQAPDCVDGCPHNPDKIAPDECGCGVPDTDTDGDQTADCNDVCYEDPDKLDPGQCGCGQPDTDGDGDQTADCADQCPADPGKTAPGQCGCGVEEQTGDADGDTVIDCLDQCPGDGNKTEPGACGCGVADADSDADGTLDCHDGCPLDPLKTGPQVCGCGRDETDSDSDSRPDCVDVCPQDADKFVPGVCGCGVSDDDGDGDGVADCRDDCPLDQFKRRPGLCGCGVNDWDSDGDGVPDQCIDECPDDPHKSLPGVCGCGTTDGDADDDGLADCIDNCPARFNPDQADGNGDGVGDVCAPAAVVSEAPAASPVAAASEDEAEAAPALIPGCGSGWGSVALVAWSALWGLRMVRGRRRQGPVLIA